MSFRNFKFTQVTTGALIVAAALALSGCVTDDMFGDDGTRVPTHASDNYPITLAKGPQTLEISSSRGSLDAEQVNAVRGFVHQAMQAGTAPMTVSRPSGGGNSARVASEVASLMMDQGVPRNRVIFTSYAGPASAPVRVSFVSTYAKTRPCGDWSTDLTDTADNTSYPNLGCAVQANIAAEIAHPETLVAPSPVDMKTADTEAAAVARVDGFVNQVTLPNNYTYAP
jgi:pilus assembly protein CpaD